MIAKPNRDAKTNPQGDKSGWCHGCDYALVQDGGVCPVCGAKYGTKRRKVSRRNYVDRIVFEEVEASE